MPQNAISDLKIATEHSHKWFALSARLGQINHLNGQEEKGAFRKGLFLYVN